MSNPKEATLTSKSWTSCIYLEIQSLAVYLPLIWASSPDIWVFICALVVELVILPVTKAFWLFPLCGRAYNSAKRMGVWSSHDPQGSYSSSVFGLLCSSLPRTGPDWSPCFSWLQRLPWGWALWRGWGGTPEHPMLLDRVGCGERGCRVLPILSTKEISIRKLCTKISGGCEVKCSGIRKCQSDVSCAVFPLCPPSV